MGRCRQQTYGASVYEGIFKLRVALEQLLLEKARILQILIESQVDGERRR